MELINSKRLNETEQKELLKELKAIKKKNPNLASRDQEIKVGNKTVKGRIVNETFAIEQIVTPKKESKKTPPAEKGNNTELTKAKIEVLIENKTIKKSGNWLEFENENYNGFNNLIEAANNNPELLKKLL